MERTLGLMCGAGGVPTLLAAEAQRQGWRIVAFAFPGAPNMHAWADVTRPASLTEPGRVFAELARQCASAVVFAGKFSHRELLADPHGADVAKIAARAGGLGDQTLTHALVETFAGQGFTVLDQRAFLADGLADAGCWSARQPTDDEWRDVRAGIRLARMLADARIGQAVVLKRGAVVAVEAAEGTTETIRRGTALAGRGAVVVKAVARDHDYRFDLPTIGPDTVGAAAEGGASVIAVQAARVLVAERPVTIARADLASIALVGVADNDA